MSITVPDIVEPIIGYKSLYWVVTSLGGAFESQLERTFRKYSDYEYILCGRRFSVYDPREPIEATCNGVHSIRCHFTPCSLSEVPHHHPPDSGCGIYAYKDLDFCIRNDLRRPCICKVALWGTVYEYQLGYRAQYGKILSLGFSKKYREYPTKYEEYPLTDDIENSLLETYQVPKLEIW